MSRKLKGASVMSLVATLSVMMFGAESSRANAEVVNYAPEAVAAQTAEAIDMVAPAPTPTEDESETRTVFVSEPMVQTVPPQPEPAEETALAAHGANSLGELVSSVAAPATLDEQLKCLAGAIYFESKGESLAGQLAVGRVVIARAESGKFPDSYCGVVYQRSQFSFVRGGRMPRINTASRAWEKAKKLALIAHQDAWESEIDGALYFHARYVAPGWRNRMTKLAQIDNHIFYR